MADGNLSDQTSEVDSVNSIRNKRKAANRERSANAQTNVKSKRPKQRSTDNHDNNKMLESKRALPHSTKTHTGPNKRMKVNDEELERLEKLVLGDASLVLNNLSIPEDNSDVDETPNLQFPDSSKPLDRVPAWCDDDDKEHVTVRDVLNIKHTKKVPLGLKPTSDYQLYLRKRFIDIHGQPSWAKLGKNTHKDVDPDMAILQTSGHMLESPKYLTKNIIEIKKLPSLNSKTRIEGPLINSVRFHPKTNVGLVAGLGCTASIFQVDGSTNNKLTSVRFDRFPIRCARFSANGNEFIVGSHLHSHFYWYDLVHEKSVQVPSHHNMNKTNMKCFEVSPDGRFIAAAGRFGDIHILTGTSKEWITTLTMNGSVEALCFNTSGNVLYSYGDQGEVYVWDMGTRRLLHKFYDEGSIKGTSLAISQCETYIAAGSSSGVVNLYETSSALKQRQPLPLKTIMNLVTSATTICFNNSSQILCIASRDKENSVKLMHLPSMTIFANFPGLTAKLDRIHDAAFSPHSGYLSLANNKSTAFLYRLQHFGNY